MYAPARPPGSPRALRCALARAGSLALFLASAMALGSGCKTESQKKFDEYMLKSKSSEARQLIRSVFLGADSYYMNTPQSGFNPVAPQFPGPSVGPTPPLGACCQEGGKCAPKAASWADDAWQALRFSVDDPHYYSYEYRVAADRQSFTVSAYGDLDCDGTYSTFSLSGRVDPTLSDRVLGADSLYRERELE